VELPEARIRGCDAIQRQHLLHRVGIAEEHHDFLEMRTAHVPFSWVDHGAALCGTADLSYGNCRAINLGPYLLMFPAVAGREALRLSTTADRDPGDYAIAC
jgi:hypothetical protein